MKINCYKCDNEVEFIQKESTDNPTAKCSECGQEYYAYWTSNKDWIIREAEWIVFKQGVASMSTTHLTCGCWITRSMFGKREVCDVGCCTKHLKQFMGKSKRELASLIINVNKDKSNGEQFP